MIPRPRGGESRNPGRTFLPMQLHYSPSLEGYRFQGGAAHVLPRGELRHAAEDPPRVRPPVRLQTVQIQVTVTRPELIGNLKLGNVWVLVQLIFRHLQPMNQLNKKLNIV